MNLKGRTALVTGGAQGIGLAVAERLAGEGASIALLDKNTERAQAAAEQLGSASVWGCDVREARRVGEVLGQIEADLGQVDILVNSAGIWRHTPVLDVDDSQWDEVFDVNVKGVLRCSQAVARGMARRGSGKTLNIASVAGFVGTPDWSAYCASKAAVISLTLSLADELREQNVQVNAVCPGGTRTPMSEYIARVSGGSDFRRPDGSRGTDSYHEPREVAEQVVGLVCPFDQATTGRIVPMRPVAVALGMPVRSG